MIDVILYVVVSLFTISVFLHFIKRRECRRFLKNNSEIFEDFSFGAGDECYSYKRGHIFIPRSSPIFMKIYMVDADIVLYKFNSMCCKLIPDKVQFSVIDKGGRRYVQVSTKDGAIAFYLEEMLVDLSRLRLR